MEVLAPLGSFFWRAVVPLSIESAVLLLAALLGDRLLPRAVWPELRLAVGSVFLLKLALPPTWASPIPFLASFFAGWPKLVADLAPVDLPEQTTLRQVAIGLAALWLLGVVAALLAQAWQWRRLVALWRAARPAEEGLEQIGLAAARRLGMRRLPPLLVAAGLTSPCVFGVFRPKILLPPALAPAMAEHALLHELAHVRRGDLPLAAFFGLLRAVYFFHPLVHWAVRRLEGLRELCCDRYVARRIGPETAAYRRSLLSFAARVHGEALAALPFAGRSSLLERLRALERAERDRPWLRRSLTTLGAALAFGCALPLAPPAEQGAAKMAEWIARPPGCLQLRYLVMERMAQEERERAARNPPAAPNPELSKESK